jgi:hypothetical protein
MFRFLANFIKTTILTSLFLLASYANAERLGSTAASALIDENGHAEIPETYTTIASNAFQNRSSLTSVSIPNSVTHVESNAFSGSSLRSVIIPNSVIYLGERAFQNTPLNEVTLSSSIDTIPRYTFNGTNLTSLIIPDSVTTIEEYAFYDLPIKHLFVGDSLNSISTGNFGIGSNCSRLITAEIKMQHIPTSMLNCTNLESVILENTISIGNNAFLSTNLTTLVLPDTLTSIGIGSFSNVPISEITFGDSLSAIGNNAFDNSNIKELALPLSLNSIGEYAFRSNSINELVIPDNLVTLGRGAFYSNPLNSVTVGYSLSSIGGLAFPSTIEHVVIKQKQYSGLSGSDPRYFKTVVVEEGVEKIGGLSNSQITEIVLPSTLVEIYSGAFTDSSLRKIDIPSSVTKIGNYAFENTNITEVVIPTSINDLGDHAFRNTAMERVIIIEPADIYLNYNAFDATDPIEFIFCANNDADLDGIVDCLDAFPMDGSESQDADLDGIGNNADTDDDNDGYNDALDAFPNDANEWVDTDSDGIGNNLDNDDDGDGAVDSEDAFPLDETQIYDITGDILQVDSDNDGILDVFDPYDNTSSYYYDDCREADTGGEANLNTDGDAKNNCNDPDDDNDGLLDVYEPFFGTNPLIPDSDFDGVLDGLDAFPADNTESLDTDTDGIGNNTDTDDDNDGYTDFLDAFPLDATEWADSDSDGIGNNGDLDDDNDGVADAEDAFPYTTSESVDTDGDGIGDNADAFPSDSTEWADSDLDGIGNNADTDDDNDGIADADDSDPLNDSIGDLPSQNLFVMGSPVAVNGHITTISIGYDVTDTNNQLNGIGFRIHYDSTIYGYSESQNSLNESLVVDGMGPYQDTENFDKDDTTDSYIVFGWAAVNADWPNTELLAKLTDIKLFVNWADYEQGPTTSNINFSNIDNAEGYDFEATNYVITVLPATWDFDGNGLADALTDGLMLLRYTFGIRDISMALGAMAENATVSATQVVENMHRAITVADIDGNGSTDALTDGLILLRYLFGLRGENLIMGSISSNATRTTHEQIEQYIETYMP